MKQKIALYVLTLWIAGLMLQSLALAENRALLIGVGEYRISEANLPGIDKDLNIMKEVTSLVGFESNQVRVVQNSQATLSGIEKNIKEWLINGVTSKDRVLFYFSGHGSQVPDSNHDESDRADEVLVPHDVDVRGNTLANVFLDDRFGEMLSDIPAGEIFVLIDSCHSGTATKSKDMKMVFKGEVSKLFWYDGIPRVKGNFAVEEIAGSIKHVGLSACMDDESAIATGNGSLFTLAVLDAVKGSSSRRELSLNQLRNLATAYIARSASSGNAHRPQILGDSSLGNKNIFIVSDRRRHDSDPPSGSANIWEKLEYLAEKADYQVTVSSNGTHFNIGETMTLSCKSDREGYLNILSVEPGDAKATVLFPNKYHTDNYVSSGTTIRIPDHGDRFVLRSKPPVGKCLVVVFHTREKINAYNEGKGDFNSIFKIMSQESFRGWEVEESKEGQFGAGKIITYIE